MKRTLLSVKELAQELGISTDSVYRAYRTGEIPGAQIARIIRFDLGRVLRAMEERAKAMRNSQCTKRARRRSPAARTARKPPNGKTGARIAEEQEE